MPVNQVCQDNSIQSAQTAADWICARWGGTPKIGIVLGTGAGQLGDSIAVEKAFDYAEIPHFPRSTATGHASRLICGRLAGRTVIAMQGRFHLYEGHSWQRVGLGIRLMRALGIQTVLISNAAGGIRSNYQSGDLMLIDSHIDLMFRTYGLANRGQEPAVIGNESLREVRPGRHVDSVYCRRLIESAQACARANGFPLHQGVYVAMCGPNFETRAEYRFLRKIGGDAVGMSTVPETVLAAQLGMRVLAVSIIANVANPDALAATSGNEVIAFSKAAEPNLKAIFENAVAQSD